MAFAGLLLGMVAGLITASIGYIALDLSILICLLIYSFVGALSTLSVTLLAHLLHNRSSEWESNSSHETAVG
ncbi:hypothetical protein HGG70_00540 [Rhodobacteraceae bacterium R_SAG4]|nr:hypothetical protein [Rhodobacteraceae bacterium R_SAG4]